MIIHFKILMANVSWADQPNQPDQPDQPTQPDQPDQPNQPIESKQPVEYIESDQLLNIDYTTVPWFSLQGYQCLGVVCEVFSGDTCTLLFPFMNSIVSKIVARLKGLKTLDIGSNDPGERKDAYEARAFLWNITGRGKDIVHVVFDRTDKRGRSLVTLYTDSKICINAEIVQQGYGTLLYQQRRRKQYIKKEQSQSQSQSQ